MKKKIRNLLLCVFILSVIVLKAQSPLSRQYNFKDGLPSSETYHVMQDSKGFIWVCSDAGVCRFDGYQFKIFNTQNGLPDNTIFSATEDHKHRIWFRSLSGALSYYYNDSIYTLKFNDELKNFFSPRFFSSLFIDKGDTMWLGQTTRFTLYKVWNESSNYKWEVTTLNDSAIYFFFDPETNGFFWAGDPGRGGITNLCINTKGKRSPTLRKINIESSGRSLDYFRAYRLKNGNYILSIVNNLYHLTTDGEVITKTSMPEKIISIYEDLDGNIWTGVFKNGVALFREGNLKSDPEWLFPNRSVSGIVQDKENGYWFSTLTEGVHYIPSLHIRNYSLSNSTDQFIKCLLPFNDQFIFAGLSSGEVTQLDIHSARKIKTTAVHTYPIECLLTDQRNSILTGGNSLCRITIPGMQSNDLTTFRVQTMMWKDEKLWVGWSYGIYYLDKFNQPKKLKPEVRVLKLFEDSRGNLWGGSLKGLIKVKEATFDYVNPGNPLLNVRIEDILEKENGILWLATRGQGVVIYNTITGEAKQLIEEDGLASDFCNALHVDKNGSVWVGTNKGLSNIVEDKGEFKTLTIRESDGLVSNEVTSICSAGNKLWIGTKGGLSVFEENILRKNSIAPPVYITAISINGKPVNNTSNLKLNYFENFISIAFTGICYKNGGNTMYKIKMEGVDSNWVYTTRPEIQYTTLPPGDYTFKAYAMNNNGVWSAAPAEVRFAIETPYWKKLWFRVSVVAAACAFIFLLYSIRQRMLHKAEKEKMILQQQITEAELKALRAQMNPHFIFNALNSIQNFILRNDVDSAHVYLGKFSRLIRNVLSNSKTDLIPLSQELQTLEIYIQLESLRFQNVFDYRIILQNIDDAERLQIPTMLIQPFVENAIWHGIAEIEEKGDLEIILNADVANGKFICSVEDNGIGIQKSLKYQAKAKKHKSMGIDVTRERLETLRIRHSIDCSFSVAEHYHSDGKTAGTIVQLILPLIINKTAGPETDLNGRDQQKAAG